MNYELAWEKWQSFKDKKNDEDDNWDKNNTTAYEQIESDKEFYELSSVVEAQNGNQNPLLRDEDFDFWTGYSNFYLTKDILNIICKTEGIESLDIVSPYRMRISVGKLFQPGHVMSKITKNVIGHINDD